MAEFEQMYNDEQTWIRAVEFYLIKMQSIRQLLTYRRWSESNSRWTAMMWSYEAALRGLFQSIEWQPWTITEACCLRSLRDCPVSPSRSALSKSTKCALGTISLDLVPGSQTHNCNKSQSAWNAKFELRMQRLSKLSKNRWASIDNSGERHIRWLGQGKVSQLLSEIKRTVLRITTLQLKWFHWMGIDGNWRQCRTPWILTPPKQGTLFLNRKLNWIYNACDSLIHSLYRFEGRNGQLPFLEHNGDQRFRYEQHHFENKT